MLRYLPMLSLLATAAPAHPFDTGTIVQSGSLSGGGAPGTQPVELDAFDDQGGTLTLDSVEVEVLTSVIGGCTTNGSGLPTRVYARLVADFSLGAQALVDTEALIDAQVSNVGPPTSVTFFDTDSGSILLRRGADLSPWIGTGKVTMSAFTELEVWEDPPGSVSFSAGGSIKWTVTYTYSSAGGTTFVEGFEGGTNEGRWSWGTGNETIVPINGNPDAYLQDLTLSTCCPAASTAFGDSSMFTGDWRAREVSSVGIDLITLDAAFGVGGRPLSVILIDDNDTPGNLNDDSGAWYVGDKNIPDPGVPALTPPGWTDFDFEIPSAATSLPAGWKTFDPSGVGASDAIWNAVITDVDVLQFYYGDPVGIYLFNSWEVGLDNARISEGGGAPPLVVPFDLRPASCPNPFNRASRGFLPSALVATADFDPGLVDVTTLALRRADGVGQAVAPNLAPPGPGPRLEDVAAPFLGQACECEAQGPDGLVDLVLPFGSQALVQALKLDTLPAGQLVQLELSGALLDGTPFSGRDCLYVVPPRDPATPHKH